MQVSFLWRALAASVVALGLAACSDSGEVGNVATTPVTTPTPVAGTVATGAPLANASVSLLCNAGGTPVTATTNAAGKYTGTLPVGCAGPYIFKATGVESTVTPTAAITLYGFADSRNNINITPITDIAARVVTTGDPAAAYAAVAGGSKKVADYWNAAAGADARAKLTSLMAQMNISIAGLADLLHQPFNATAGDALDNVLEAIKLERGGVSLAALAELVAKNGGTAEDKPWTVLFPKGSNTLSLTATDCVANLINANFEPDLTNTVSITAITITRGVSTVSISIVPNASETTLTFTKIVVGSAATSNSDFGFRVDNRTTTFASPSFSSSNGVVQSRASFTSSDTLDKQTFSAGDSVNTPYSATTLICRNFSKPLLSSALNNFYPQARLASFVASTPTQTVTSTINDPAGCSYPVASITYTYSLSKLGDFKINTTTVPSGWLNLAEFRTGYYRERASFQGAFQADTTIYAEAVRYAGFNLSRSAEDIFSAFDFFQNCAPLE
jgi:hypothetical protein